jgi:hypothetical protein
MSRRAVYRYTDIPEVLINPTTRAMEAVSTSETSVYFYEATRRDIPQVCHLHTRCRENLKSHSVNLHGETTLRCVQRFEALRIKKTKRLITLMMKAVSTSEMSGLLLRDHTAQYSRGVSHSSAEGSPPSSQKLWP